MPESLPCERMQGVRGAAEGVVGGCAWVVGGGQVGGEAAVLDDGAGGGVVFGDGEFELAAAAQGGDVLDDALAVRARAHEQRAPVIAQRAGDDFGGAGGLAVDQYGEGEPGRDG